MAEQTASTTAATVPAAADLSKAVADAVAAALGPVTESLRAIGENQKIIADTLAKLPPAPPSDKAAKAGEKTKGDDVAETAAFTPESVQKLVAEAAAKSAVRQKYVDELKTKGVAEEVINAHLPSDGDEAAFKAAADKAVVRFNAIAGKKLPDNAGTAADGGTPPGQSAAAVTANAGKFASLSKGEAAYASNLKLG